MTRDDMRCPKSDKQDRKIRGFTEEEQALFVRALMEHEVPKGRNDYRAQLLISLYSGLRMGEVNALKPKDIDFEHGLIRVRSTVCRGASYKAFIKEGAKTEAGIRRVSIPATAKPFVEELVRLAEGTDGKYLFTQEPGYFKTRYAGKRIRSRQLRRHLKEICEKIGIIYKPPHKLRKTYASILKDSDIDEQTITDMIGHVDFGITEQYYLRSRKMI